MRGRRGGRGSRPEPIGSGSGEDSFVAVVVTKLTGALLFILLITMVIMALVPRGAEPTAPAGPGAPLALRLPGRLPEAIVGRPYELTLATTGGRGALRWELNGPLPTGLEFDAEEGRIVGTPRVDGSESRPLLVSVADEATTAVGETNLTVLVPTEPLGLAPPGAPRRPAPTWQAWLRHGFGFLVLGLVSLFGAGLLVQVRDRTLTNTDPARQAAVRARHRIYQAIVALVALGAAATLAAWLAGRIAI